MLVGFLVCLCVAGQLAPPSPATAAKDLLGKMVEGRRSFATGDIQWRVHYERDGVLAYRRSQFDGANYTFIKLPDEDGRVDGRTIGEPGACIVERYLRMHPTGEIWSVQDNATGMGWYSPKEDKTGVSDVRVIGLMPEEVTANIDGLLPWIFQFAPDEYLSASVKNNIATVKLDNGQSVVTWQLDTERGHSPIRVERRLANGKLIAKSETETALYDNRVWFPRKVLLTQVSREKEFHTRHEITSVSLDDPAHPKRLDLYSIGAVPYAMVRSRGNSQASEGNVRVWTGFENQCISLTEMQRRIAAKTIAPEELAMLREKSKATYGEEGRWPSWCSQPNYGLAKSSDVDAWETYVRRFCIIHKLDDRQKASARSILDDCRKHAGPIVAAIKKEPESKHKADRVRMMSARVEQIFTGDLVPRLKSLLTIPQSQPASQPAAVTHGR